MKDILITRGSFAGRVLSVHDDTAAAAIADKWGREPGAAETEGEAGEVPQSLTDFEAALNAGGLSTDAPAAKSKAEPVSEAKDGKDQNEPFQPRATRRSKL